MSDEGKRSVDIWATSQGTYIKVAESKRAKGPYKDMTDAIRSVSDEVAFPFTVNMRDPATVPDAEWPITRSKKS